MSNMIADPLGQDPNDPNRKFAQLGGTQGAALASAPTAPMTNLPAATPFSAALQKKPQFSLNPQLPQAVPAGAPTDSTYLAQRAQLQNEISQRYNDVLKQLGYLDPGTGQFVMGRVETEANRQREDLTRSMGLAGEETTRQMQQAGTLFSGYRGTQQARAEHPFVSGLADLDINVPTQLSDLYEQAGNTVSDYTLQNNLLLADAARRRADELAQQPAAAPAGPEPAPGPAPGPEPGPPLPPPPPTQAGVPARAQGWRDLITGQVTTDRRPGSSAVPVYMDTGQIVPG